MAPKICIFRLDNKDFESLQIIRYDILYLLHVYKHNKHSNTLNSFGSGILKVLSLHFLNLHPHLLCLWCFLSAGTSGAEIPKRLSPGSESHEGKDDCVYYYLSYNTPESESVV